MIRLLYQVQWAFSGGLGKR